MKNNEIILDAAAGTAGGGVMERLTYRDKDGFPMMKKCGGFKQGGVERLAAYEDTELTPGEAKRMSNILMDVGIDYNCSWEYVKNWLLDDRLRELAEADKDGRLVVLPCKVGDTVWATSSKIIKCEIDEMYLCDSGGIEFLVSFNCDGADCKRCPFNNWTQDCSGECYCDCEYGNGSFKDSDIGKTVFLTCEEAEKACGAKMDGGDNDAVG